MVACPCFREGILCTSAVLCSPHPQEQAPHSHDPDICRASSSASSCRSQPLTQCLFGAA